MGLRTLHKHRAVVWTAGTLVILAMAAFLIRLFGLVRSGHGLDPYTTGRGVETNPIQALTTVVFLAVISLVVGVVIVLRRRRRKSRND
jgi:hypothetical protein